LWVLVRRGEFWLEDFHREDAKGAKGNRQFPDNGAVARRHHPPKAQLSMHGEREQAGIFGF
jgi:hypothetical protein